MIICPNNSGRSFIGCWGEILRKATTENVSDNYKTESHDHDKILHKTTTENVSDNSS